MQTSNIPGTFKASGIAIALFLAFLGIGFYVRRYFGLHPIRLIRQICGLKQDDEQKDDDEKKTGVQLLKTTVMLWMVFLLTGLYSLSLFLLVCTLIIVVITLGSVWKVIREKVMVFLGKYGFWLGFVSAIAILVATGLAAHKEDFSRIATEPFSWNEGISMWPGEIIRILAGILSIIFMVVGWRRLKENDQHLNSMYFSHATSVGEGKSYDRARARRVDWCAGKKENSQTYDECKDPFVDTSTNWAHYQFYRTLPERWRSVLYPAMLFFLLGCVSIYWVDDFLVPYRGDFVYRFDYVVVFGFMVPAFLLLLFSVIDETSLCVGWIRMLTQEIITRTRSKKYFFTSQSDPGGDQGLLEIWTFLQVIAQRTHRVGNLIVGPFIVLFFILVSQSPYFDNWDIPVGLIVMIMLSSAYAMLCAFKLRRASENVRRQAISELTRRLIQCDSKDDKEFERIEFLLEEVRQIKDGGFLPWIQQPWLKAVFWLLSALGIMSAEFISLGAI